MDAILLSFSGQTALNCGLELESSGVLRRYGVRVLGTPVSTIEATEDRQLFVDMFDDIGVKTARSKAVSSAEEAVSAAKEIGFPVMLRAAFALGGKSSGVARNGEECFTLASRAFVDVPQVLVEEYLGGWKEIELDAVARQGELILWAISEHIEKAGVHSGDATLVFPAQQLSVEPAPYDPAKAKQLLAEAGYPNGLDAVEVLRRARKVGETLAHALQITGPFNVQRLVKHDAVKVIECNLRASRSFSFVSKVSGVNFIREATRAMLGVEPSRASRLSPCDLKYVAVKAPQFSFDRLKGADPKLGVEMTSTGEVACFGATWEEALLKAMLAAGFKLPSKGALLALDSVAGSTTFFEEATILRKLGLGLFATPKPAESLRTLGCVGNL